jgi:protein TonB
MNPEPPHLTRSVPPHYPEQDKEARRQGTVLMDVLLRNDGTVGSAQVISGLSTTLNEASVNAIQQWRYEPVTCNGVPVESETMVQVNYTLSGY